VPGVDGEPFGGEATLALAAFRAVVLAEVKVASADSDNGEVLGLAMAALGNANSMGRHRTITMGAEK
jgi:hypothetical protein